MKLSLPIVATLTVLGMSLTSQAALVSFGFEANGLSIEGDATQSMTVDGVTLSSVSISTDGVINTTASGLGVNTTGTLDEAGAFDNIVSTESWTFEFSSEIVQMTLDFGSFTGADQFILSSPGGDFADQIISDSTANAQNEFTLTANIPAGNDVALTYDTAGPASSTLLSIQIDTIPEPTVPVFLLLGFVALSARRSRR